MKYLMTCLLLLLTTTVYSEVLVPVVKIQTNMGIIIMELYPDKAPKTVENFLRYAKEGFYEGTIFHRVIKNFIIQTGGYTTDYTKKPTHDPVANESKNGLKNLRGYIAMARNFDDPDSATSQFFINVNNNYSLDYQELREELGYTVFGQLIGGMDVVDKIQATETGSFGPLRKNVPKTPIIIAKITIEQAPPKGIPAPTHKDNLPLPADKASEDKKDLTEKSLEPPATDKKDPVGDDKKESIATPVNHDKPKLAPNAEKIETHNDKAKSVAKLKENGATSPENKIANPENKSSKNLPANKLTQPPPDAPSNPDKPDSLSY
jgi:cyclophilin family peptidyl-prolyl cis-trans isomerase